MTWLYIKIHKAPVQTLRKESRSSAMVPMKHDWPKCSSCCPTFILVIHTRCATTMHTAGLEHRQTPPSAWATINEFCLATANVHCLAYGSCMSLQTASNRSPIARFLQRILENCWCMLLLYDSAPDEKITVSMVDLSDLDVDHLSTRGFWDLSAEILSESSKRWSSLFCTQLREKLTTSMTIESASMNVMS